MIREFPTQEQRVETGPIQFGADWPGIFIRGDNAFALIMAIDGALRGSTIHAAQLRNFAKTLGECNLNVELNAKLQKQVADSAPPQVAQCCPRCNSPYPRKRSFVQDDDDCRSWGQCTDVWHSRSEAPQVAPEPPEMKPPIHVHTNSAGYVWQCAWCGKAWAYGYHNLEAVNSHSCQAPKRAESVPPR